MKFSKSSTLSRTRLNRVTSESTRNSKTINSNNVDGALELYQELRDAAISYKRLAVDLGRLINEKEKNQ